MLSKPSFINHSRVLLLAPHPDDESLACSVILQRAVRAGASIRVIYATDGQNNPWPQRALERKWRLSEFDRARWGERRRKETLAALEALGIAGSNVHFLGLPDQGLTNLLLSGCARTLNRLKQCIVKWAPTDIFWPDINDIHPDHSALGVMLRLVSETLPLRSHQPLVWNFLVHGDSPDFFRRAAAIRQTSSETMAKLNAINCHDSQLKLSRRRFIAYAGRPEFFAPYQLNGSQPPARLNRTGPEDRFVVTVPPVSRRLLHRAPNLFLLGYTPTGELQSLRLPIDLRGRVSRMFDAAFNECIGLVRSEGTVFSGLQIALPSNVLAPDRAIYLKVERRAIFFDETGWIDSTEHGEAPPAAEPEIDGELSLAVS